MELLKVGEKTYYIKNVTNIGVYKIDENFVAKKYSRTPFHLCELITGIDENGNITTQKERYGSEEE